MQAFAAGAALCSTSLGTTFTILSTSGLSATRLGTVLTTAAMMDDVVGLVMVQVISNLGESDTFKAVTVLRPLAVSIGFALATPIICKFLVEPATRRMNAAREKNRQGWVNKTCEGSHTPFLLHTLILLGFVTASSYAGTSNLFASYLAGASISWWDSEVSHLSASSITASTITFEISQGSQGGHVTPGTNRELATAVADSPNDPVVSLEDTEASSGDPQNGEQIAAGRTRHRKEVLSSGSAVYETYYGQAVQRILKPFFFVSSTHTMASYTNVQRRQLVSQSQSPRCLLRTSYGVVLSTRS